MYLVKLRGAKISLFSVNSIPPVLMNSVCYNVIAVMSGTSLDGVDISYIELCKKKEWSFQIIYSETICYAEEWKTKLKNSLYVNDLAFLDEQYTEFLSSLIKDFIVRNDIRDVVAICSHGHTVYHQPSKGITKQIGNLPILSMLTGYRTVCDFRVQDVLLGGQGAPLVPIGDQLLFGAYDYCLNLGGFANVSYDDNGVRKAYDICAVNVVLNHFAAILGSEFDDNGAFAKAGLIDSTILKQLNELPYYTLGAPKSLGIEWVHDNVFPILSSIKSPLNALATYTYHIVVQLSNSLKGHGKVLVTGGGAKNKYLIAQLMKLTNAEIIVPAESLIDYKEALIFGLLGVLKLRNEDNCLASVTGASIDHSSGNIYLP